MPSPMRTPNMLRDLPEFEQPIAAKQKFARGNLPGAYAHVASFGPDLDGEDPNTVYVDNPSGLTKNVLAHELMHQVQRQAGGQIKQPNTALLQQEKDPQKLYDLWHSIYDYGGTEGLQKLRANHGTIANLNSEQQADIPENYLDKMDEWGKKPITPKILRQADQLNSAYEPFLRQESAMANPSRDTIDTTPAAPGPPPASLTGMIKPLPMMGGKSLNVRSR